MNQKEIKGYTPTGFGQYAEGLGTLRASGGDYGGGTEVLIVSYQEITGCLSQGAHPGSYNGQDAYNDMLVTEYGRADCNGIRSGECRNYEGGGVRH